MLALGDPMLANCYLAINTRTLTMLALFATFALLAVLAVLALLAVLPIMAWLGLARLQRPAEALMTAQGWAGMGLLSLLISWAMLGWAGFWSFWSISGPSRENSRRRPLEGDLAASRGPALQELQIPTSRRPGSIF